MHLIQHHHCHRDHTHTSSQSQDRMEHNSKAFKRDGVGGGADSEYRRREVREG